AALERAAEKPTPAPATPTPSVTPPAPVQTAFLPAKGWETVSIEEHAKRGLEWLVSVQGNDGGWGQDAGSEGGARQGVSLETTGNDVANTSIACLALLRSGTTPKAGLYRDALLHGVEFVLANVEAAPPEGLAITKKSGTQIQRKLGPYIDTFLATLLLSEIDGYLPDATLQTRVRTALARCTSKIETNQQSDGSWNQGGGWAPVIGTSLASRGLAGAMAKGVKVDAETLRRVDDYTVKNYDERTRSFNAAAGAGVELYQAAQAFEQASRNPRSAEVKSLLSAAKDKISDTQFLTGFGSMGGEEFVSYMNISDSLRRDPGAEWLGWNSKIKSHLAKLQNQDGTWAGHHCITGRVACTSAAVLTLLTERTLPRA
ncbi:MAG TPA: hypothetical protein VKE69_07465, partial [Planctomycetota bacterium]|nr:hypothetical protein [Planctomycetota bacterium]